MSRQLGFLDLPSKLRQRIYGYSDITGKTIELNWQRNEIVIMGADGEIEDAFERLCWHDGDYGIVRRQEYRTLEEYWEYDADWIPKGAHVSSSCCEEEGCFAWNSCFALLLTCRTIFLEIYERIYGKNRFLLDRSGPGGFQPFFKLGWYSIRALTHLTIRLDGEPSERIDMSLHWTRTSELLPMKHYSRYGKQAYKQWADLVGRLRECPIVPRQLSLFLIARVPDMNEAALVLQPLQSLPTLKGCGIWLNDKPIPELKALIKETVSRLITPQEENVVPFRYLDLPQELRLRILGFSDLCATIDLEWKPPPHTHNPIRIYSCSCHEDLGHIDEGMHHDDCEQAYKEVFPNTNGLEMDGDTITHCCSCPSKTRWYETGHCKLKNDPYMCIFNCSNHSSYTGPERGAWKPFCHPLFLVSRQVRQDAIPVFFRKRQFVITPMFVLPIRHLKHHPGRFHPWSSTRLSRTELSLFFSSMAREALRHIRYLEWLLPACETYREFPQAAYFDYLDTIELMVQALTLTNLTLVVNMRAMRIRDRDREGCSCDLKWPVRDRYDGTSYNSVLSPLCRLGENGLKDCWVYLRLIWKARYDWGYNRDSDEMRWEKKIMGDSRYSAFERGKPLAERVERVTREHPRNLGGYAYYRRDFPQQH